MDSADADKPIRPASVDKRFLLVVGALLIVAITTAMWRASGADERRVNAACDLWLEHRDSLRTVLTESDEAVERADASHATTTGEHFNDVDTTLASLERWEAVGPGTLQRLDREDSATPLERGAESAFGFLNGGVTGLHRRIQDGDPAELAGWVPEARARFQNVDDICLAAAR